MHDTIRTYLSPPFLFSFCLLTIKKYHLMFKMKWYFIIEKNDEKWRKMRNFGILALILLENYYYNTL